MQRVYLDVPYHAPEGGVSQSQLAEGAISLDVVGQERAAGSKVGPGGLELAAHVLVGVQAVVHKEVSRSRLSEQPGQHPGASPAMESPPVPQFLRHGDTPEPLGLSPQGR